ncbi:MAG TPA: ATP-binding cassette domain-containing protein [Alphaproteobacteria bacterium]|jgi:ATP-binding cassette subfamily F protein 3|nr:ATP-binding cassette domain-containing protein [Alphaproteobacteria bacterium]
MSQEPVVIRFDKVSFEYPHSKIILDEASFSVHKNSIVTIIGQNGAGKSTIFKLLLGKLTPTGGKINLENGTRIGIAEQMVPVEKADLTILEYFNVEANEIRKIFSKVNLDVPVTKKVKELSGGQKARLLLAYALISNPDVLLLDEPTNNLDKEGVNELTVFLMNYEKTCIVISHDADFLNCFTDGVLNLDIHTKKVEQFVGNYYDVIEEIAAKLERDRQANARLEKSIKDRFLKINKLGGKSIAMSQLARKIRSQIDEDKEDVIEMRQEDRTIPEFDIPNQEYVGYVIKLKEPIQTELAKKMRLQIKGPNGIGKSTLLKKILAGEKADINPEIRIGYYSQDFSELDFNQTAFDSLLSVRPQAYPQEVYEMGARFLLTGDILKTKVENLSEGQKGLLCYARLCLQRPGLLILDEPTNHINFRHIPVITQAIENFEGPVIFVSHLPEFFEKIKEVREVELIANVV